MHELCAYAILKDLCRAADTCIPGMISRIARRRFESLVSSVAQQLRTAPSQLLSDKGDWLGGARILMAPREGGPGSGAVGSSGKVPAKSG